MHSTLATWNSFAQDSLRERAQQAQTFVNPTASTRAIRLLIPGSDAPALAAPRKLPVNFNKLAAKSTSTATMESIRKGKLTLPTPVIQAVELSLRAATSASSFTAHFQQSIAKIAEQAETKIKDLCKSRSRDSDRFRYRGGRESRSSEQQISDLQSQITDIKKEQGQILTEMANMRTLISASQVASQEVLGSVVTADANITLAQRDKLISSLHTNLDAKLVDMRSFQLDNEFLFPPVPPLLEHLRTENRHDLDARLAQKDALRTPAASKTTKAYPAKSTTAPAAAPATTGQRGGRRGAPRQDYTPSTQRYATVNPGTNKQQNRRGGYAGRGARAAQAGRLSSRK